MNLRMPHTQAQYNAYRRAVTADTPCFLCLEEAVIYEQWKLVKNAYPYDIIAKPNTHFMLCPKRHVAEEYDLTNEEIEERNCIVRYDLSKAFSCIMLNFEQARTHKSHLHYHLWVNRD
jgi:diadenosine tetraphosphate (Ap4A) HIT family hydrolase